MITYIFKAISDKLGKSQNNEMQCVILSYLICIIKQWKVSEYAQNLPIKSVKNGSVTCLQNNILCNLLL